MEDQYLQELLQKYKAGTISDAEKAVLDKWYLHVAADRSDTLTEEQRLRAFDEVLMHLEDLTAGEPKVRRLWPRIAAAASIVLALGAGTWLLTRQEQPQLVVQLARDIPPGHNQATLILSNGQQIILKPGLSGRVATQSGTTIHATNDQLVYTTTSEHQVSLNSVATAKGEQLPFPLVLADGTKVWLNAESKLTFPTAFNGKERLVKLTGEAYFEVKHNERQPFRIAANDQVIEDLGTAFNVNAYANEKVTTTTLVEGSVKVNHLVLKPGQQTDGQRLTVVNTARFTAWKGGDFDFQDDDIETIMRQLARWYDMEVVYAAKPTDLGFYATITRKKNISAVLKLLERTGQLHFKIEGRRVTVSN